MKQICLYKPPTLLLSVLLFGFVSCKKENSYVAFAAEPRDTVAAKPGPKPGFYPEVSLKLTVSDAAGNKITSDGGGDYFNGLQNLKVVFDAYGNFMFSGASNNPNVPLTRFLRYDFSDPSPLTPNPSITGIYTGNFISTGQTTTNPDNTPLQNLATYATKCIGLSAGINIEGGVVNFHRNQSTEDTPTTPTAFVYVTRINPAQWLMSPVPPLSGGGCSDIFNVAALRINGSLSGYYNMPFLFTLTKI